MDARISVPPPAWELWANRWGPLQVIFVQDYNDLDYRLRVPLNDGYQDQYVRKVFLRDTEEPLRERLAHDAEEAEKAAIEASRERERYWREVRAAQIEEDRRRIIARAQTGARPVPRSAPRQRPPVPAPPPNPIPARRGSGGIAGGFRPQLAPLPLPESLQTPYGFASAEWIGRQWSGHDWAVTLSDDDTQDLSVFADVGTGG